MVIKNISVLLLFLVLTLHGAFGQPRTSDVDVFLKSVVFINEHRIKTEIINGVEYELFLKNKSRNQIEPWFENNTGTAFFVIRELDLYLVTAEHVARNTSKNTSIVFADTTGNPYAVALINILEDGVDKLNNITWVNHPDADVSVVRVNLSTLPKNIQISPIPIEWVYNQLDAPHRQVEITAYGFPLSYPLKLGPSSKFSPVTKTYKAASGLIDMPRGDNKRISTFYLVDDPSVSGLSGSPVIALPHTISEGDIIGKRTEVHVHAFWLMGIVHGTMGNNTGGYGAITPSKFISEAIDLAPCYEGGYNFKYPDGSLWSERVYKKGKPWRVISNIDPNGRPQKKGTLNNGTGTLYLYDEQGNLKIIKHYKDGILVKNQLPPKEDE